MPTATEMPRFPAGFRTQQIATNGVTLHVRGGGHGPAALLLRGMGLSSRPPGGYDKKTQGQDIAGVLDALGIARADLVLHDIGNMVGYAFAAQYRERVSRFVVMDAPLPGVGPWEEILKHPLLWH